MGFNRQQQQPSQPQPRPTTPSWRGQQQPQMQPGQRPQRPQMGMRPQRPPQVDARVQALRNRGPMQRPQMGQAPDYQNRMQQRQQQFANAPRPSEAEYKDIRWRKTDPGGYAAMQKYGGRDRISSPWMSAQGVITQEGHRLKADTLRDQGYYYRNASGSMPGRSGDNDIGTESDYRPAGWYKRDMQVRNPQYDRWRQEQEGDGMAGMIGLGGKAPSQTMSIQDYDRYMKQQNSEYDRFGRFTGGGN